MARGGFSGTQRISCALPVANLTNVTIQSWAWINAAQAANNRVWQMGDGTHGVGLGFQTASRILQVVDESIAWRGAGVTMVDGQWLSHGLVRSGGGVWQVYINGTNTENPTAAPAALSGFLTIGNDISATHSFNGAIGPLSVWSSALSANEMLALARGVPPMSISPTTLAMHLPMFGALGAGGGENDWSVAQKHGTQTGNPPVPGNPNVGRPTVAPY